MEVRDYNGQGKWSTAKILKRYSSYCHNFNRIPHQYREYAKLLKKVGFSDRLEEIREKANTDNPTIMKVIRSLMTNYLY